MQESKPFRNRRRAERALLWALRVHHLVTWTICCLLMPNPNSTNLLTCSLPRHKLLVRTKNLGEFFNLGEKLTLLKMALNGIPCGVLNSNGCMINLSDWEKSLRRYRLFIKVFQCCIDEVFIEGQTEDRDSVTHKHLTTGLFGESLLWLCVLPNQPFPAVLF